MKNILIVVDMQNDFIDGALGTKEAVAIVPKVEEKIRNFDGEVFFTRDTHETYYLETQEGKNLPVKHCIRDTEGWQIRKELDVLRKTDPVDKETFGSTDLAGELTMIDEDEGIGSITPVSYTHLKRPNRAVNRIPVNRIRMISGSPQTTPSNLSLIHISFWL